MTDLLIRLFVKDRENVQSPVVRSKYGFLSSVTGIVVNLLLSMSKLAVGLLSNSVSIVADAINNLSDAGSSIISFVGFKMASRPADKEHPFGHARVEYITTIIVAVLILFLGVELGKSSVEKIINPVDSEFGWAVAIVLVLSILGKLWLYFFNRKLGKIIDSQMMMATAADSISDVLSTTAVLVASIISAFTGLNLDGYMGILVAIFICKAGIGIALENMRVLLGEAPDRELIRVIYEHIAGYDGVKGIHDLMVHNYGPNMWFASVHVEVSANSDILHAHDTIDNIERDMWEEHNIRLVIHMDPIEDDNQFVRSTKVLVNTVVKGVDERLSIHDFRMVVGPTHTNLIFDVLHPYDVEQYTPDMLKVEITKRIKEINPKYMTVITVDREFVPDIADMPELKK